MSDIVQDLITAIFLLLISIAAYIWLLRINWKIGLCVLVLDFSTTSATRLGDKYKK